MSEMENVGPCIEVPVRKVLLFRLRRFIRQFRRRFVPYVIWHGQQVDVRIVFTDAPLGGARKSRLPYMEIEKEGMMSDENVVSIGDWRINRKHASYSIFDKKECRHLNTTMMDEGQYIRCDDCNAPLSAYWVLSRLLQDIRNTRKEIRSEQQRLALAHERALRLKAAQTIEGAWRSRTMVPACPHCTRGIFAADMLNPSYVSKEIEMQRRKTEQPPRHSPLANIEILRAQEKILEENSFGRNPPDVAQEVTQGPKK